MSVCLNKIFLLLSGVVYTIGAAALSTNTVLDVTATGSASVYCYRHSLMKGIESGLLHTHLSHEWSDRLASDCSVRISRTTSLPLLETASITAKKNRVRVTAGFLTKREGLVQYYKSETRFQSLLQRPLLWEAWGLGVTGKLGTEDRFLSVGTGMNFRENAHAHLQGGISTDRFAGSLLAGIQANDLEYQDISAMTGTDLTFNGDKVRLHGSAGYLRYFGHGYAANPTMMPGWDICLMGESSVALHERLGFDVLGMYRAYEKKYLHKEATGGVDMHGNAARWLITGISGEIMKYDAVMTVHPEVYIKAPLPEKAGGVQIGVGEVFTDGIASYLQITGNVWFTY